ncbi:MAG: OmpA family protein [Spirochaetaceae bacterium]|jgi:outer membrane protein OmpA-like peptidoglycan-associated protein/flagellar hook assembly protein FlgD|nr:OmpA family protein [Spirochaetaceae bacterium]
MKKTSTIAVIAGFLICAAILSIGSDEVPPAAGFPEVYISPNNDGVKDTLSVPFSISDKRYIEEWRLVVTDKDGKIVRTIMNKETRPVSLNFKEFWRRIFTPKHSITVPKAVVWDGTSDSGDVAPDGRYFYSIQASDDNGNVSESEKRVVIVDCTPPAIELAQPSAQEKFFGEGAKSSIRIRQSGSPEDLWTASIADTSDNIVRSWKLEASEPVDIVWDGRDSGNVLVPDGVYSYTIKSTDRAGNVSPQTRVSNIVYSGDKPVTNIALSGSRYFSPPQSRSEAAAQDKTDTRIKTITMIPSVPTPSTGNSLQNWRVEVIDSAARVRKTYSGGVPVPANIVFDGFDDSGSPLLDGVYKARLTASYLNGYTTPGKLSPDFVLDRSKPQASISLPDNIFSPNGDGDKDAIVLRQALSETNTPWRGEIVSKEGGVVRGFDLGGKPAPEIVWDGLSDSGVLCPDGDYTYRVLCTNLAGNRGGAVSLPFALDNSATELIMSATPGAFSPNGDSVQDSVRFSLTSKSESGVVQYSLAVTDAANRPVRTFTGNSGLPPSVVWDGKTDGGVLAPEGLYYAKLSATARNGSVSNVSAGPVALDITPPAALVNAPYILFDPEPDSTRKVIPMAIKTEAEKLWTGAIIPAGARDAKPVRSFVWYDGEVPSFDWDGTDDSGNVVPDGAYRFTLSAQDPAGNRTTVELPGLTVDTRPTRAWITTLHETIAPNGNKTKAQVFNITSTPKDGVSGWTFKLVNAEDPAGEPVRVWQDTGDTVPDRIEWDGRRVSGGAADGVFIGVLETAYTRGKSVRTESPAFVCSAKPPVISAAAHPEFFSPDNDGVDDEESISLSAFSYLPFESWSFEVSDPQGRQSFWTASGKSQITRELVWDGRSKTGELVQSAMDYPYTFTVNDVEGQSSTATGILRVDVLVIRDGDKLKMQVPAITFRADHADFVSKAQDPQQGLDQSVIDNNTRILRRIAQILNKFKDYTIVIEGHAHNISGTETEETSTAGGNIPLVPLSNERAAFVKKELVKLGVSAGRMTTTGMGGRKPVANPANRDDWWKDRRVEFILNK